MDDLDELAARAAIANWRGKEGAQARELQSIGQFDQDRLKRFLSQWGLARSNPNATRAGLLEFLNQHAIPALRLGKEGYAPQSEAYQTIDQLAQFGKDLKLTNGKQTSLLSKLGLSLCPEIFIPYDSTVRAALVAVGKRVRDHAYSEYMDAVMSEKPAFDRALRDKNLTPTALSAADMSPLLFEMRALDKRLMLRGGFNPEKMAREVQLPSRTGL